MHLGRGEHGGAVKTHFYSDMLQVQSQDYCRSFCGLHCRQGDAMIIMVCSEFRLY